MTPSWQIILNAIQANARGAAYIMDLSITQKTAEFAVKQKKGKNRDGDITPTGFVSTDPYVEKRLRSSGFASESAEHVRCLKKTLRKISPAEARRPVFPVRQSPCLVSKNTNMTECRLLRK